MRSSPILRVTIKRFRSFPAASLSLDNPLPRQVQHFTNIPWPDPRYWELLPYVMRRAIFESLASCDFVGLQPQRATRNFLHSCEAVLPDADIDYRRSSVWYKGRLTMARNYPISIDAPGLLEYAESPEVKRYDESLAPLFTRRTILRVDRMEPSKNIVRSKA